MKDSTKTLAAFAGLAIAISGFAVLLYAPFSEPGLKEKLYVVSVFLLATYYSYFSVFVNSKWGMPPRPSGNEQDSKFDALADTPTNRIMKLLRSLTMTEILVILLGFAFYSYAIYGWMKMLWVPAEKREIWVVSAFVAFLVSSSFIYLLIFRKGFLDKKTAVKEVDPILERANIKKRLLGYFMFIAIGLFNLAGYIYAVWQGAPVYRISFFQLMLLFLLPPILKDTIKALVRINMLSKAIDKM